MTLVISTLLMKSAWLKDGMSFFINYLFAFLLASQAMANNCFDSEFNVSAQTRFTAEDYFVTLNTWQSQEPESPGILELFLAYRIYKNESETTAEINGDKRQHCYIGCRITESVSYEAAMYAAWYKEYQDLTDCKRNTYFEVRDYEYTLKGAHEAEMNGESSSCYDTCSVIER